MARLSTGPVRSAWWWLCSYKLKFDMVNPLQRFFGLKRLQLHASIGDPTLMRERLSYSLFREMGVPTVRQTHATVAMNGHRLGVHLMTEVLDGRWADANFNRGDGNLYKEVWPTLTGASAAEKTDYFKKQLRTNNNPVDNPDVTRLVAFSDALGSVADDYELTKAIQEYTAARSWARFFAIDRAIDAWDGPTNFRACQDRRPPAREPFWRAGYAVVSSGAGGGDCVLRRALSAVYCIVPSSGRRFPRGSRPVCAWLVLMQAWSAAPTGRTTISSTRSSRPSRGASSTSSHGTWTEPFPA